MYPHPPSGYFWLAWFHFTHSNCGKMSPIVSCFPFRHRFGNNLFKKTATQETVDSSGQVCHFSWVLHRIFHASDHLKEQSLILHPGFHHTSLNNEAGIIYEVKDLVFVWINTPSMLKTPGYCRHFLWEIQRYHLLASNPVPHQLHPSFPVFPNWWRAVNLKHKHTAWENIPSKSCGWWTMSQKVKADLLCMTLGLRLREHNVLSLQDQLTVPYWYVTHMPLSAWLLWNLDGGERIAFEFATFSEIEGTFSLTSPTINTAGRGNIMPDHWPRQTAVYCTGG